MTVRSRNAGRGAGAKAGGDTTAPPQVAATPAPEVVVTLPDGGGERRFTTTFRLGRGEECDVRIDREDISRAHAEVAWEEGGWLVRDLQSTNGTFLDGQVIERAPLPRKATLSLGAEGPKVGLTVQADTHEVGAATVARDGRTVSFYAERYLDGSVSGRVGERTEMIRRAFRQVMGKRRRRYVAMIGFVTVLLAGVIGYSVHQHRVLARQQKVAEELFYNMKSMELHLVQLEERMGAAGDPATRRELEDGRVKFAELQRGYDKFLQEIDIYNNRLTEQERLVLRIARVFGECEAAVPKHLTDEVQRFIGKWQADEQRLPDAVRRSRAAGYNREVVQAMLAEHLPPQFYYIALQESDFQVDVCGPETRFGIAKGAWQLIPSTAIAYGLKTGPLYLVRQTDPRDERHDFVKSTEAAARYLHDIYGQEAQASGLLVVASYNWGENGVRALIRSMPENPRDRNFWRLWVEHRREIPRETYQYVFRIFAAAVIGENPRLFGFDYINPLAGPIARAGG
jgi:membrane-bound lytic murein transglycosylase D